MAKLFDFTRKKLEEKIEELGLKKFKARQIMQWIYQKKVFHFSEMSNIAKSERVELESVFEIGALQEPQIFQSADSTKKLAFTLFDGNVVESVVIPEEKRNTLCVSTQIGCPLRCAFCKTGSLGFKRNLTTGEIVGQAVAASQLLEKNGERLTNVVFMGMGEPLLNFDALIDSIDILTDDFGLNFSNRKITVSTAGIADKISELGEKRDVNLAVSLHATTNEKRDEIMPINKKFPLETLFKAIEKYPVSRKRVLLEYIMLKDFNDSPNDASILAKTALRLNAKVNLIPFNSFEGSSFKTTPMEKILDFQRLLIQKNVTALVRKSRGNDKLAACGQLGKI